MRTKRPTPSSSSQDCEAQKEFAFKKLENLGPQENSYRSIGRGTGVCAALSKMTG